MRRRSSRGKRPKGSYAKIFTDTERNGYEFSGIYTHDKEEAKKQAKEYRNKGYYAKVLTGIYERRIGSAIGHSVYIKKKGE